MNRESNYKKKLLIALLLIVAGLAGTLMPQRAAADDVVNAPIGSSGLTWSYTEATKTLTISNPSGTPEAMPDFSYQDGMKSPWAAVSKKIETVTIEDGVTTIGTYAFDDCWALQRITIPDGVTAIGYCAFMNCSALETITIPASVKTIGDQTFYGSGLIQIEVAAGNTHFTAKDGVLYNKGQTILICYPPKKPGTDFTVPSTVQTIDESAFQNCKALKTVILPDGLTTIKRDAFQNCTALKSITIPDGVTTIGYQAFDACKALEKITLPASVTAIGGSAFGNCTALTDVTVEWTSSITNIDADVFEDVDRSKVKLHIPAGKQGDYEAAGWTGFDFVEEAGGTPTLTATLTDPAPMPTAAGSEKEIKVEVTNGRKQWKATIPTEAQTWLEFEDGSNEVTSDQADFTLKVKAKSENTEATERTATIEIKFTDDTNSKTIIVTQAGTASTLTLTVTPATLADFTAAGETKSVTVTSPEAWEIDDVTSFPTWLQVTPTSGVADGTPATVNITAGPNTDASSRRYTLTFKTVSNETKTITVTQAGTASTPTLTVTPVRLADFTAAGETKSVTVTSPEQWEIDDVASFPRWLGVTPTSGVADGTPVTVNITAGANTDASSRSYTLTFKTVSNETKTITVTQAGTASTPTLTVTPATLADFTAASEKKTVTVTSTEDWSVDNSTPVPTWLHVNPDNGMAFASPTTVEITADANTTSAARSYTLTFKTVLSNATQAITVTQAGTPPTPPTPTPTQTPTPTPTPTPRYPETLPPSTKISGLTLNPSSITLNGERTFRITATIAPANAADKRLIVSSSDESVVRMRILPAEETRRGLRAASDPAVVTIEGTVYGIGKAKVNVKATDGSGLNATCDVEVRSLPTANMTLAQAKIYAAGGQLHLTLPTAAEVQIYHVSGALLRSFTAPAGESSVALPQGVYVVRTGAKAEKVVVQ